MGLKFPSQYRVRIPFYRDDATDGGAFLLPGPLPGRKLLAIASNGLGWEHVSVSPVNRRDTTPTWAEMSFIKDVFWGAEDAVMQLHPPRSTYVNNHNACLHLWRPINGQQIPLPAAELVGVTNLSQRDLERMSIPEMTALANKLAADASDVG